LFATQWFFSIFAYDFPMELVLRIYDVFLNEGVKFGGLSVVVFVVGT